MAKVAAKGTKISYLVGSTYTDIANLKTVSYDLGGAPAKINVSTHDDTSNFNEYVTGRIEPGSVQISGPYDPDNATHAWLRAQAGETHTFKATLPNTGAATETFSASVGGLNVTANEDGALEFSCVLEILGASTHAA